MSSAKENPYLCSLSWYATTTGRDRETINRAAAALPQVPGPRGAKLVDARLLLPILLKGEKAGAQAEKESLTAARTRESTAKAIGAEIDNETKLKTRIPLEVFDPILEQCFTGMASVLKKSKLSDDEKEEALALMRDVPARLKW